MTYKKAMGEIKQAPAAAGAFSYSVGAGGSVETVTGWRSGGAGSSGGVAAGSSRRSKHLRYSRNCRKHSFFMARATRFQPKIDLLGT